MIWPILNIIFSMETHPKHTKSSKLLDHGKPMHVNQLKLTMFSGIGNSAQNSKSAHDSHYSCMSSCTEFTKIS